MAANAGYDAFAREVKASGVVTDPWVEGKPRLREEPIVLDPRGAARLASAAEAIAAVYDEMVHLVLDAPELAQDFFALTPFQLAMWQASAPMWHGIARADLFETSDGLAMAELNCDTPTGEPEAVVLGAIAGRRDAASIDPARDLEGRFVAMVEAIARRELDTPPEHPTVGLVYPTEFTEDLAVIRLYKRWFEARGHKVVLGSPYNLGFDGARATLFDQPIDVMVRHYKTDWWGERASAWTDDELADTEPLAAPLQAAFAAMANGKLAVVNPFASVLPQNKRAMAFFWEHIHRFSSSAQAVIQKHVPVTSRLERVHEERLYVEREAWVLKSAFGAEGDEVIIGRSTTDAIWRASIDKARPGSWIAQRYFDAKLDAAGETTNLGVFLIAGRAAGFYARLSPGATDGESRSAAVLLRDDGARFG
jgi:glutathionylspermidine synthase